MKKLLLLIIITGCASACTKSKNNTGTTSISNLNNVNGCVVCTTTAVLLSGGTTYKDFQYDSTFCHVSDSVLTAYITTTTMTVPYNYGAAGEKEQITTTCVNK